VVAVLMVTVLVVYIIVLDRGYWEELCEKEQLKFGSNTDCNSNTTRYLFVAAAIVQLVITMGCCVRRRFPPALSAPVVRLSAHPLTIVGICR
jgi:uncharacterized membrane protein